jgi:hypothetical protein
MRRLPCTPRNVHGARFCWSLSRSQDHSAAGRISSIAKSIDKIGNLTRDLPACSIVRFSEIETNSNSHFDVYPYAGNSFRGTD